MAFRLRRRRERPSITYAVDRKQYVAVATGGRAIWGYPQGDALMVFALPTP